MKWAGHSRGHIRLVLIPVEGNVTWITERVNEEKYVAWSDTSEDQLWIEKTCNFCICFICIGKINSIYTENQDDKFKGSDTQFIMYLGTQSNKSQAPIANIGKTRRLITWKEVYTNKFYLTLVIGVLPHPDPPPPPPILTTSQTCVKAKKAVSASPWVWGLSQK